MRLHTRPLALAAVLAAAGPVGAAPPTAPAPRPATELTAVYHLRNVAAADAAPAVRRLLADCEAVVAFDAAANHLLVRGSAGAHARVAGALAGLDREPPQVLVPVTVARVPAGFLRECGLAQAAPGAAELAWVLTEREAALFRAALRHAPGCEVVARPEVLVRENQTGVVRVGHTAEAPVGPVQWATFASRPGGLTGVGLSVTPRVTAGGAVELRAESQVSATYRPVRDGAATLPVSSTNTVNLTVNVPAGGTAVLAVPGGNDGKASTVVYVLTPRPVR